MEQFYNEYLQEIKKHANGATIVNIEHNEMADEGMIMTLSNGHQLIMGWPSETGYCHVKLGETIEPGSILILNK
jgi:hypothetical protein